MNETPNTCFLAKSHAILAKSQGEKALPDSIQLFPPAQQTANLMGENGAQEFTTIIDEKVAELLEAARADYQTKADLGVGDAPYIDFNHDDKEASGWVKEIFWAGQDPMTGGVRAKIDWSDAGKAAVTGKAYRRFSPSFLANAKGEIVGAPINMGGLVNRAGFANIQPLFAKQTISPTPTNPPTPMSTATDTPKPDPVKQEDQTAAIAALTAKITELNAQIQAFLEKEAGEEVELAAKQGRIPPAARDTWKQAILNDPKNKALLQAQAPNPELLAALANNSPTQTNKTPSDILAEFALLPSNEQPAFFAKNADALKTARDATLLK